MMRAWLVALLIGVGLAGCGGGAWQTKDISGLMPPLELQLSGRSGAPLTEADLQGRTTLLFFGYTSCPDVCPATLARLAALRRSLPDRMTEAIRILFVSVDPARDHPERLAAYVTAFGAGIVGVTGTPQELRALTRRYRTTFSYGEPDADGQYAVSHPSGVYVFDGSGKARLLFRPGDSLEGMQADLVRLLSAA